MNIGKSKYTREEIQELLSMWQQSGKSKKQFADELGIKYMTFIEWYRRYLGQTKKKQEEEKFIPLAIEMPASGVFAEIYCSNGKRILFHQAVSAEYIQKLL